MRKKSVSSSEEPLDTRFASVAVLLAASCSGPLMRGTEDRHRPPNATSRAWQCLRSYGFSDREHDANCALAIAWKHAPNPTPPTLRSTPRPAPSLARARFAGKRAPGSRPRRVARRSRYRPEGGARRAAAGRSLLDECDHRAADRGVIAPDGEHSCGLPGRRDRIRMKAIVGARPPDDRNRVEAHARPHPPAGGQHGPV